MILFITNTLLLNFHNNIYEVANRPQERSELTDSKYLYLY
jgi:hypothetical protein